MGEKYLNAAVRWLRSKWEYIKFLWQHDHYFICTDEPTRMTGKESSYWHIEKCWCGKRQEALNNWCDGHQK
jgi:hypothetical protein